MSTTDAGVAVTQDKQQANPGTNRSDNAGSKRNAEARGPQAQQQGPRGQQAAGTRRGPAPLTESETKLLQQLIEAKMKNPYAQRELLRALQRPDSRFVAMSNQLANQVFRTIQDLDRVMSQLDRQAGLQTENLEAKHHFEKDLVDVQRQLVNLTGRVALQVSRRNLLLDTNSQQAYDRLEREAKAARKGKKEGTEAASTPATAEAA